MDTIKITEDKSEMEQIGRTIVAEHPEIYTPLMLSKIMERIKKENPEEDDTKSEKRMYCSIYDYWVYGNDIDEEFFYHFYEKNHAQKNSYMTNRIRTVYMDYLCCGDARVAPQIRKKRIDQLEMKYECYKKLAKYYKRDVIEIIDENDYDTFKTFVAAHNEFVVKPSDFCYGIGVHKAKLSDYRSVQDAFDTILAEGQQIQDRHPSRKSSIVIEELIVQAEEMAQFHRASVNSVRVTAVRDKNGKIVIFHPWLKCGVGGRFVVCAALDGFDAEIDSDTGIVITDGFSENGKVYQVHPDSGIRIKGFQIPKWDELKRLIYKLMEELPEYGYIGWDMVLTTNGWVVMEANYAGECMWQMMRQCGGKEEFENLIGWKMDADFWWQIRPLPVHKKN